MNNRGTRATGFDNSDAGHDLLASVVVFLVALPLCMGIAIASGVPPAMGILTGIIGGIVVGAISGAPLQVSGPAAGLTVIVWQLIQEYGLEMLAPVLVLAGLIQICAGALRLGQWFRAISPAVVYGMLGGIGVLIFASQFHVMVDDKPQGTGLQNLISIPKAIYKGIFPIDGSVHHIAAVVGILTIVVLVSWTKFRPQGLKLVPAPLLAVVVGTGIAAVMDLPIQYVKIPGNLLAEIRLPSLEMFGRLGDPKLLIEALALAFIASAETLLSAVAVDKMHTGPKAKFDRELAAQGVGNMLCGAIGALPMTGVIVRSSANVDAGAKTRRSAMLHGIWLLALVVSLPHVLEWIPTASLAAILVYTGYKLASPESIRKLKAYGWGPVVIYAVTLVGIVATDLLTGVVAGLAASMINLVYRASHLRVELKTNDADPNRRDLILDGAATFIALPKLADALEQVPAGAELHVHVEKLYSIDHTCLDLLAEWEKQNEAKGNVLMVEWDHLVARYNQPARASMGTRQSVAARG